MAKLLHRLLAFALVILSQTPAFAQVQPVPGWGFPQAGGGGGGSGAPDTAPYITIDFHTGLSAERKLTAVSPLSLLDNGAGLTVDLSLGTVPLNKGGSNATTAQGAINNFLDGAAGTLGAAAANGDVAIRSGGNWLRLPKGLDGQVLTLASGLPEWSSASTGASANLTYITLSNESGTLPNSRQLAVSSDLTLTDAGAGGAYTLGVNTTVVKTTGAQSLAGPKTLTGGPIITGGVTVTGGITMNAAPSDGITMNGTSFSSRITIADPTGNRVFTVPDIASADFVLNKGTQTIDGLKTFSSFQLSSNTFTINGGSQTITIPAASDTVVNLASSQTLTNKTLSAVDLSGGFDVLTGGAGKFIFSPASIGSDITVTIADPGTSCDLAFKTGTPSAGSVAYGNANVIAFTSPGASGAPLISNGTSAPAFTTLGLGGGGTNNSSLTANNLALYAGDGSKIVQTVTAGASQSWRVNSGGTAIEAFTPGTGSVTSAAIGISNLPISVSGSPITGSGTITLTANVTAKGYIIVANAANSFTTMAPGTNGYILSANSGASNGVEWIANSNVVDNSICQGRLTLTSGSPIMGSVSAAGTLYFTPYKGNRIALYVSSAWQVDTFTERSLSLTLTSGKPYDIFAYDNSGTVTLESLVWTDDTTRATALTTQDGVLVKSGDATRRYLGTIYASASNQTEFTASSKLVWNYYNRVEDDLLCQETANSYSYTTATWREANAGSTIGVSRVRFVCGYQEDKFDATRYGIVKSTSNNINYSVGIGLDAATSTNVAQLSGIVNAVTGQASTMTAYYRARFLGLHTLECLEIGDNGTTFYGDNGSTQVQSGMTVRGFF